jgi:SWI/SNF-related matrix-associated actin-dependent regulator 1 of chromatin subfamily A
MATDFELSDYQVVGRDWLAGLGPTIAPRPLSGSGRLPPRVVALGDDPGLGKTAQAIRALDKQGVRRFIVVGPAAVRQVWPPEIEKWEQPEVNGLGRPRIVLKATDHFHLHHWLSGRSDVLVMSYEFACKHRQTLMRELDPFQPGGKFLPVLVLDEAHYLKEPNSARTKAILGPRADGRFGLIETVGAVYWLSGSLFANETFDAWTLLHVSGATELTFATFKKEFFEAFDFKDPKTGELKTRFRVRDSKAELFKALLRGVCLRRTDKLLGLEVPTFSAQLLDGNTAFVQDFLRAHPALEDAMLRAIAEGRDPELGFSDFEHMRTLERLTAEAKAPAFVELLTYNMQNGMDAPFIVGVHTDALNIIENGLKAAGFDGWRVDGKTNASESRRTAAVKGFQAGEGDYFLGNIRAVGVGLTLTRSNRCLMFEQDWSPEVNRQAWKRIHRRGQQRKCIIEFAGLRGTVDERKVASLARKSRDMAKVDPSVD